LKSVLELVDRSPYLDLSSSVKREHPFSFRGAALLSLEASHGAPFFCLVEIHLEHEYLKELIYNFCRDYINYGINSYSMN